MGHGWGVKVVYPASFETSVDNFTLSPTSLLQAVGEAHDTLAVGVRRILHSVPGMMVYLFD